METLEQLIPANYYKWIAIGGLCLPYITRAYHAIRNGGGLKGVWMGIWYGTNQPKSK